MSRRELIVETSPPVRHRRSRQRYFVLDSSAVTTANPFSGVLVVDGVAAGCVMTIVVPGPTTEAALRRNSSGILMTLSNRSVETVVSSSPATISQRGIGFPVIGEIGSFSDGSSIV